ncbi:phosphatidate cytidylyltransferase [Backusella circina FSU 941]|nr:phosphatidate cytidylyltransferase [Backusella circina FSU 941]
MILVTVFWIIGVLNIHKDKLQESILHYSWIHLVLLFTAPQTLFISLNLKSGLFWFIFPCLTAIINDSSAYFIGRSFGKHQLISLSPNKTVEGFTGAAVITTFIGYLNTHSIVYQNIGYHGLIIALFTTLLAPIGDLVGSAIKRAGKVKDFDNIIPGHGGISDRVDSHLFMCAFTYLYYQFITQTT